ATPRFRPPRPPAWRANDFLDAYLFMQQFLAGRSNSSRTSGPPLAPALHPGRPLRSPTHARLPPPRAAPPGASGKARTVRIGGAPTRRQEITPAVGHTARRFLRACPATRFRLAFMPTTLPSSVRNSSSGAHPELAMPDPATNSSLSASAEPA